MLLVVQVYSPHLYASPTSHPSACHCPHTQQCGGITSSQEASQAWTGVSLSQPFSLTGGVAGRYVPHTCFWRPPQSGAPVVNRQQHPLLSLPLLVSLSHSPVGVACTSQISYSSQALRIYNNYKVIIDSMY